jgi:hypothetical protein
VRVVDAERAHAALAPEEERVAAGVPQPLAVVAPEVERVDVLVLLRRVLGVGDGAVGALPEPVGVLLHPRVVGRALEGEVERHLEAEFGRTRDELREVVERAELGVHRRVPARLAADGPRAPHVGRPRGERVVRPLAERHADRVDGRQVHHVEAEGGDARQHRLGLAEGAVPPRLARRRAGEELVPRGERRALALDEQRQLAVVRS